MDFASCLSCSVGSGCVALGSRLYSFSHAVLAVGAFVSSVPFLRLLSGIVSSLMHPQLGEVGLWPALVFPERVQQPAPVFPERVSTSTFLPSLDTAACSHACPCSMRAIDRVFTGYKTPRSLRAPLRSTGAGVLLRGVLIILESYALFSTCMQHVVQLFNTCLCLLVFLAVGSRMVFRSPGCGGGSRGFSQAAALPSPASAPVFPERALSVDQCRPYCI